MPDQVLKHSRYLEDREGLSEYLVARLSAELALMPVQGRLPLLRHCAAALDERYPPGWASLVRGWANPIAWPVTGQDGEIWVWVTCQGRWLIIAVASAALLASCAALLFLCQQLLQHRRRLLRPLRRVRAEPRLVLRPATSTMVCGGREVRIPATPFIYYLWYARRRQAGKDGGWYLNPASSGADTFVAEEVLALMDQFGAHPKARRELAEKGLRAKVLDQNRSKVKDELVRVLGEEIAADYLFDAERDGRSARYRYRLRLEPGQIDILASADEPLETSQSLAERPL